VAQVLEVPRFVVNPAASVVPDRGVQERRRAGSTGVLATDVSIICESRPRQQAMVYARAAAALVKCCAMEEMVVAARSAGAHKRARAPRSSVPPPCARSETQRRYAQKSCQSAATRQYACARACGEVAFARQ